MLSKALGAVAGERSTRRILTTSKSMSHALLTPSSPYPKLKIARGQVIDPMGISIRVPAPPGSTLKAKTHIELLPEESLYLLERGSLQIWIGREAETAEEVEAGLGEWADEEWGVKGAIEMSVQEGFGIFIGKDALTWERYQVSLVMRPRLISGVCVHETSGLYGTTHTTISAPSFYRGGPYAQGSSASL
jgi:hypothetical protein